MLGQYAKYIRESHNRDAFFFPLSINTKAAARILNPRLITATVAETTPSRSRVLSTAVSEVEQRIETVRDFLTGHRGQGEALGRSPKQDLPMRGLKDRCRDVTSTQPIVCRTFVRTLADRPGMWSVLLGSRSNKSHGNSIIGLGDL